MFDFLTLHLLGCSLTAAHTSGLHLLHFLLVVSQPLVILYHFLFHPFDAAFTWDLCSCHQLHLFLLYFHNVQLVL